MANDSFNADFYVTAASVIPVLYLALTLQGPTFKRLLGRSSDESLKLLLLEQSKEKGRWLSRQVEMWGRGLLVAGFMYANVIILCSGLFAEPIAIVALYHRSASPFSGQIVLILMLALLAVVVGNQVFILVTTPTLGDRLKKDQEKGSDETIDKLDNSSQSDPEYPYQP